MEWLELIGLVVVGILGSMLANDIAANVHSGCSWLVRLVVRHVPEGKRARLEEEWLADLEGTEGSFPKLFVVFGLIVAVFRIRSDGAIEAKHSEKSIPVIQSHRYTLTIQSSYYFNTDLLQDVSVLQLSDKALDILRSDHISFLGDMIQKTESEMLTCCDREILHEMMYALSKIGLHFGMELPDWPPKCIVVEEDVIEPE